MYRTWTLSADLSPAALQLRAIDALGVDPGVDDGVWASVAGLGDAKQPPAWMLRLQDQLARDGIAHELY